MRLMTTLAILVLVLLGATGAQAAPGDPPPIGDPFFWERRNMPFEEYLTGLEKCRNEGVGDCIVRVPFSEYAAYFKREGFDIRADNLVAWLRENGEVRACPARFEQYLVPTSPRISTATWERKRRRGEQCVYIGGRPVLSLNCGNPIVVGTAPIAPKQKSGRAAPPLPSPTQSERQTFTQHGVSFCLPHVSVGTWHAWVGGNGICFSTGTSTSGRSVRFSYGEAR